MDRRTRHPQHIELTHFLHTQQKKLNIQSVSPLHTIVPSAQSIQSIKHPFIQTLLYKLICHLQPRIEMAGTRYFTVSIPSEYPSKQIGGTTSFPVTPKQLGGGSHFCVISRQLGGDSHICVTSKQIGGGSHICVSSRQLGEGSHHCIVC